MGIVKFDENQISSIANALSGNVDSVSAAQKKISGAYRTLSVNDWIQNVYDLSLLGEIHGASDRLSKQTTQLEQLKTAMVSVTQTLSGEDRKKLGCRTGGIPRIDWKKGPIPRGIPNWVMLAGIGAAATSSFEMPHWKGSGALKGKSITGSTVFHGVNISGTASGELIGGSYDISPTSIQAEGHLAKGTVSGNIGIASGSLSGTVGKLEAKGSVGATLYNKEGRFTPNISAKASAEATLLEGEAKAQVGSDQFNAHAKASGKLATAKAEASAQAGVIAVEDPKTGETYSTYGAEAKAGASAYLASGKVSGGVTIFGVKIDASVSGHAGGAGAEIGGSITSSSASGDIGAGLGLGVGIEVKIDWSNLKFGW